MSDVITTMSGRHFDYNDPSRHEISVEDIAVALGNTCRFGGHVRHFYSVAEHAVLVYKLLRDGGQDAATCYAGLHHDSHEAYLTDAPTPLKEKIMRDAPGVWEKMEAEIDAAICATLGVREDLLHADVVRFADRLAFRLEGFVLKDTAHVERYGPPLAPHEQRVARDAVTGLRPEDATEEFLAAHWSVRIAALGSR